MSYGPTPRLDVEELRELRPTAQLLERLALQDARPFDDAEIATLRAANRRMGEVADDPAGALIADHHVRSLLTEHCRDRRVLTLLAEVRVTLLPYRRVGMAPIARVLGRCAEPGLDGVAVTRRLRAKALAVPILLLTARDALEDRVAGLDAGSDDYLVKPFEAEELTARLRALLRRNRPLGEALAFADLRLDPETAIAAGPPRSRSRAVRPSCWPCCCATAAPS